MRKKLLDILRGTKRRGKEEIELRKEIKETVSLLRKFDKNQRKISGTEAVINKMKKVQRNIRSVFITFKYRIQRDLFFKIFPSSRYQSWYKLYGNFKIGKNRVYFLEPPSPININWENLDKGGCEKFGRRLISWMFFIGFFFLSNFFFQIFLTKFLAFFITREFAIWKDQLQDYTKSCSEFSNVLTNENILSLAENWKPAVDGIKCLCVTRSQLVTQE